MEPATTAPEKTREFMSDEEIARMFPNPESAARVRIVRDRLEERYHDWQRRQQAAVNTVDLQFAPRNEQEESDAH